VGKKKGFPINDTKPLSGASATSDYPSGVNICRQRKAGNITQPSMLSRGGTNFNEPTVTDNTFVRK
jgi:hypothetical protein